MGTPAGWLGYFLGKKYLESRLLAKCLYLPKRF